MMVIVARFLIFSQLFKSLGRIEVRFNIGVSLIGPISSLRCQKKIPNRPPDRSFYADPNPDAQERLPAGPAKPSYRGFGKIPKGRRVERRPNLGDLWCRLERRALVVADARFRRFVGRVLCARLPRVVRR